MTFNHFHSESQAAHSAQALDTLNPTLFEEWAIRTKRKLDGLSNKSFISLDTKVFLVNLFLDYINFHLKQFKLS